MEVGGARRCVLQPAPFADGCLETQSSLLSPCALCACFLYCAAYSSADRVAG